MKGIYWTIQVVTITLLAWSISLFVAQPVSAEGSRNLTENGGYRPWLQYSGNGTTTAGILRDNVIKAYANEGETIYLGSSAMGIGAGNIVWTAPDGTNGQCSDQGTGNGLIVNRAQEIAGPAPLVGPSGYTPCTLTVGSGQSGIWLIVFTAPRVGGRNPDAIEANAAWTQPANASAIAAWDVTVVDIDGQEKAGRAYASYLPLTLASFERSIFSEVFVLTKDGYQYSWDLNGIQPTTFILFSNKKGFKLASTDEPSYQSVPLVGGEVNNLLPPEFELNAPDDPDLGTDVTNKIFFNLPNPDLPLTARRPNTETWLLRAPVLPVDVSNATYVPTTPGPGGVLSFESNAAGRYEIFIDTNNDGSFDFESDVVLTGEASAGLNTVPWNGRDPNGNPVELNVCYQVLIQGIAGEVHFPIYDAEKNPNGMIFERLNGRNPDDYVVYYNDVAIGGAQALNGENSFNGAHAWTTVPGGDPLGFGNQRGIDTWTYAVSEDAATTLACAQANLVATKRDSLLTDVDNNGLASPGDTLQYEIVIENTGAAPATNVVFDDTPDINTALVAGSATTTQGTITSGNGTGDTRVHIDIGTIPGAGSVVIRFSVVIDNPLPDGVTQVENQGLISSTGQPITPTDDPDTPEPDDPTVTPVTATPILDAFKTDVFAIDADGDGIIGPGDQLEYQITITNSGNRSATNVFFDDTPGSYTTLVTGTVGTTQGTVELGNGPGDTTVRINVGTMPVGGNVDVTFRVDIDSVLPPHITEVENQGFIRSVQVPTVPTDDPDTPVPDDPTATPVTAAPALDAFKRDSLLIDADDNGFASPGDTLVYEITILNNGNITATNVIFNDTPDRNTTLVVGSVRTDQGTIVRGNSAGDSRVSIDLGAVRPNGNLSLSFSVIIDSPLPNGVTKVENQGLIGSTGQPVTPTDDPDTPIEDDPTVTPVITAPILDALKTDVFVIDADGNGEIGPGDRLEYQIIIVNQGNRAATGIVFEDTPGQYTTLLPGSVQTSQGTVELGNSAGDTAVRINIGTIPAEGSVAISFRVDIDNPLPPSVTQVENQGFVRSNQLPTVPTDDPDTPLLDDPTATPVVTAPALDAFKRDSLLVDADGNGFASPGDTLVYDIVILNNGNTTATNVVFDDTPDTNTALVVGSVRTTQGIVTRGNNPGDTSVGINIGDIPRGGTVDVSFRVTINSLLPTNVVQVANQGIVATITTTSTVLTDDPDTPAPNDPTVTPVGQVQLIIAKSSTPGDGAQVKPGEAIIYRLAVTNTGNVTITGLIVTDTIPAGTTYVPDSATPAPVSISNALVWAIPMLGAGQSVDATFMVRINDSPGVNSIRNVALMRSNQTPPIPSNETEHPVTEPTALGEVDEPSRVHRVLLPLINR